MRCLFLYVLVLFVFTACQSKVKLNNDAEFLYKVQYGDTLSGICYEEFQTVDLPLMQLANPEIKDVNRIYAGKTIRIPKPGFWANKWKQKGDYLDRHIIEFDRDKIQAVMLFYYINYEKYNDPIPYRLIFALVKQNEKPQIIFDTNTDKKFSEYKPWTDFDNCLMTDLDGDGDKDFILQFSNRGNNGMLDTVAFHKEESTYKFYRIDEGGTLNKIENRVLFFSGFEGRWQEKFRYYNAQYHWTGKGFRRAKIKYSNWTYPDQENRD